MAYFRLYLVVAQNSSSMRPFAFSPAFPYRGRSASNSSSLLRQVIDASPSSSHLRLLGQSLNEATYLRKVRLLVRQFAVCRRGCRGAWQD